MSIPRDPEFDGTLAMLREGYDFVWSRCRRLDSDLFRTRILGKPAVCIHGPEAAALFYDETKFQRHGAIPRRVVTSLFGKKAVHTLDDAAHHKRKSAFLALMTPESLERLTALSERHWRSAIARWQQRESIVLFDEAQRILTAATCEWAGIPLEAEDVPKRARDFGMMVDAFGGVGPWLWRGKLARVRTERWMMRLIDDVRRAKRRVDAGSALYVMAHHRDDHRALLPAKVAAVELINVIRPTVAVSWYIAFAALALHMHPEARERLAHEPVGEGAGGYADAFMQEVRRFYPFTPYLGAKVRAPFVWKSHRFKPGTLVLLDVYGSQHDPRIWDAPEQFRPERFEHWRGGAFDFIPQGGGPRTGHRCPGEWITMHNLTLAVHFLARCMAFEVPIQDLRIDITRMPTRPKSGFVMRNVRATAALNEPAPHLPSIAAVRDSEAAVDAGEVGLQLLDPGDGDFARVGA
jgi:fatty-acid peroxygenase